MPIDSILSQVTGSLNWSSLSWEVLLRALLILLGGIIFNKLLLRTVDRLLLRSTSLASIQRYLRSALSVLLWLVLILVVLYPPVPGTASFTAFRTKMFFSS